MTTEQYAIGYETGYQDGWNAAMEQPAKREPLTDEEKLDLVTDWFAEDWAIEKALGLLRDFERKNGTTKE